MGQRPLFFHRETVPMRLRFLLPTVQPAVLNVPTACPTPACPGSRFRFSDVTLDNVGASTYN